MKPLRTCVLILTCLSVLAGCEKAAEKPEPSSTDMVSPQELAQAAYSSLLSGDNSLLDEEQLYTWWSDFIQSESFEYEYTCLDLDGDGVDELLIQMADDPCSYNAVFHYDDGKLFCWNSDAVEMCCWDEPLRDSTMVRQYHYSGTRTYTVFRYQADGEVQTLFSLFAREELISEDSALPCPYYEIDGEEVEQSAFEEQLDELITNQRLDRSDWTAL